LLLFTTCQKDIVTYNDGYDDGLTPNGPPAVTKTALATDTAFTATTTASMGDMIAIFGENLSQVKAIRFNDVETDIKTVYAVNSRITVPIPRAFPTKEKIDNKLTITTSKGSITLDFVVTVPDLIVAGFYNDFANAGDTVQIVGKNFDLYELTKETAEVTLEDGTPLKVLASTSSSLSVIVPEDTPDGAIFRVHCEKAREEGFENPVEIKFRDPGVASIQTFGSGLWGTWVTDLKTDGSNPGDPKPLLNAAHEIIDFSRLNLTLEAYAWEPGMIYGGGFNLSENEVVSNPENYCLKFEINTNKAITCGNILIECTPGGDNARYKWNPAAGGIPFNTNKKWETITIEMTDCMKAGWDLKPNGWNSFAINMQPEEDIAVDYSIANIRIVKKLK
jgi:hypothetical protein